MLFDFGLLDARNGSGFDCGSGPTQQTLIVASTPRCGSTMLCRTLWETGLVGAPKEYFNPTQRRDWNARFARPFPLRVAYAALQGPVTGILGRLPWSYSGLREYTQMLQAHRTGSNGWFSTKLHWHHFERIFDRSNRDPSAFFGPISWVYMRREDRVAQAVSWARALQTERWAGRQVEKRVARYSRPLIDRTMRWIEEGEVGWEAWFQQHGVTPIRLSYEAYVSAHASETGRVLNALGVEADIETIPAPPTSVQRDELNAAWCARYRESS